MIVKHSQRDIQEEQDKQLSGNDLCDMVGVCGGLRESKSAWSSQAQGRYVSSSVLKTKWRLCRAQMPNVPGIKEALRAKELRLLFTPGDFVTSLFL